MKNVLGIVSIVLFPFIFLVALFNSYSYVFLHQIPQNAPYSILMAILMLIGGIVSIISKHHMDITITAALFYFGAAVSGIYHVNGNELFIYCSVLNILFGILCVLHVLCKEESWYKSWERYRD